MGYRSALGASKAPSITQFKSESWYYVIAYGRYVQSFPGMWMLGRQICSSDQQLAAYASLALTAESSACASYNQLAKDSPACSKSVQWLRLYVFDNDSGEWMWRNVDAAIDLPYEYGRMQTLQDYNAASCSQCNVNWGSCPNTEANVAKQRQAAWREEERRQQVRDTWGDWRVTWDDVMMPFVTLSLDPSALPWNAKDWSQDIQADVPQYLVPYPPVVFPQWLTDVPPPPVGRPTPTKEMLKQMAAERDKLKALPRPSGGYAPDTSGPGKVPWVALGIGAAAVGGLGLLWWAGRKS